MSVEFLCNCVVGANPAVYTKKSLRFTGGNHSMDDDFKEVWESLQAISKQEQLLETVDPVNKQFIKNSLKSRSFKIYDASQPLPYELSDEYLEGKQ